MRYSAPAWPPLRLTDEERRRCGVGMGDCCFMLECGLEHGHEGEHQADYTDVDGDRCIVCWHWEMKPKRSRRARREEDSVHAT
jgi:hypothetical protein